MVGAVLMQHGDEESYVSNQGSIEWKDGRLKADYVQQWPFKWTVSDIKKRMMSCLTAETITEWCYLNNLLLYLSFKIPYILFTHARGVSYR